MEYTYYMKNTTPEPIFSDFSDLSSYPILKITCKICSEKSHYFTPPWLDVKGMICYYCKFKITNEYYKIKYKFIKFWWIYTLNKKVLEDIREFGMRPDRIFQTLLFDSFDFIDTKK